LVYDAIAQSKLPGNFLEAFAVLAKPINGFGAVLGLLGLVR
jgi:hypothetical protein